MLVIDLGGTHALYRP